MRLVPLAIALSLAAACYADVITLKNGRTINGTYLGGTARQIKVEVGDNIQTLDVGDVARIEFSNAGYTSSRNDAPRDDGRPTLRRVDSDSGSNSGSGSSSGSGSGSGASGSRPVILQPDPNDTGAYPSSGSSGSSLPTDDSRPTLRRAPSSDSSSSSSSSSDSDSNKPTLRRAPSSDSSSSSSSDSDSNKPTLRRAPNSDSASSSSSSDGDRPVLRRAAPDDSAAAPAPTTPAAPVQIPAQTEFVVRMIDAVDSQTAKEGDVFRASLDQPVMVNGQTAVQRGVDAQVKLVQAKQSGKFTGKTELTLSLWSVTVNGKIVGIDTQNITKASSSRGAQTAKVAGGAAAAGAVIGAIAGGGKGAAIGAGAGGAGGAAVEAGTKGQRVQVASETLLTFTLDKPVDTSQGTAADAQPAAQSQPQLAPLPPPPPPAPALPRPTVGQTQDAVVASLGYPDSVDASGDKQIYIYKNMKVTFVNGKVSKVE
jgi:hypothetical protein